MAKVLVIEDNPGSLRLALTVLGSAGHETLDAPDAVTGLEIARRHQPDVVLMDVQLPGMDGLEATRQLKGDPRTATVCVIALSAFAMKGDRERFLAAGCDECVAKPYHYPDLLAAIERVLKTRPALSPRE